MLATGELRLVLLGALARRHPAWSEIRALAAALAEATGARLGYPAGGRQCGRCGARRCDSAPRYRRTYRRAARSIRGRDAAAQISGRTCWWARSRAEDFAVPGRAESALAGGGLRHRAHAVCGCGATGETRGHPADRRLCGDLGHLGQRRGTLAECCGRGASPGRSAARLEGAARTREPARRDGIRLPELRGRSQRAARARWTGCTPHRRPRARLSPAI